MIGILATLAKIIIPIGLILNPKALLRLLLFIGVTFALFVWLYPFFLEYGFPQ